MENEPEKTHNLSLQIKTRQTMSQYGRREQHIDDDNKKV